MNAVPETKYAKSGDFHIAYQTIGTGPFDLVFMHGWISHSPNAVIPFLPKPCNKWLMPSVS